MIGIAVLRPDLFEVDRLLASTATHAIATGVVLAIFTAANLAAGLLLPGASVLAAVAATSLCAPLLAPLRARLQQRVHRWLYPARRAALAAIDELNRQTAQARNSSRPSCNGRSATRRCASASSLQIGRASSTLLVRRSSSPVSVPVRLGDEQIGLIDSGRTSRELLRDIAAAAAPTVEAIRLRLGLRQALREVEASRSRMLRAGYEERQRLERDLHDGAQLRLVSLGMALRIAQRHLGAAASTWTGSRPGGRRARDRGQRAAAACNGIRPSCLDDGLVPALSVLIDTVPIPSTCACPRRGSTTICRRPRTTSQARRLRMPSSFARNEDRSARGCPGRRSLCARGGRWRRGRRTAGWLRALPPRRPRRRARRTLVLSSPRNGGTTVEAILPCAS